MTTCERCERFSTQFALIAILVIVLLVAPVSSSASAMVSHFVADGPFTDAGLFCNPSGGGQICAQLSVFSVGSSTASIFYALFLPDGSSFQGFGTIPSVAPTDTSTLDPSVFTNTFLRRERQLLKLAWFWRDRQWYLEANQIILQPFHLLYCLTHWPCPVPPVQQFSSSAAKGAWTFSQPTLSSAYWGTASKAPGISGRNVAHK
jgi:hypothetical protein